MLLTHLIERNAEYADAAAASSRYKILDNSLIELKGAVSLERVLAAAQRVQAQEIILPDVFQDGYETKRLIAEALDFLEKQEQLGVYKLMGVCQGYDAESFARTFDFLEKEPRIDVIGIPKVCAKMHPAGRVAFEHLWRYSHKPIHLLGIWYSWQELAEYVYPQDIRSVDTCLAAYQVYNKQSKFAVRPDGYSIDLETATMNQTDLYEHIQDVNAWAGTNV